MLFLGATLRQIDRGKHLGSCLHSISFNIYVTGHIMVTFVSTTRYTGIYRIPHTAPHGATRVRATTPRLGEHSPRSRHRSDASRSHRPNRSELETCFVKTSCRFMLLVSAGDMIDMFVEFVAFFCIVKNCECTRT